MSLQLVLICGRCGKRVHAETCKIDDHGEAVHEECAVSRLPLNHTAQQERAPFPLRRLQMLFGRGKSLLF
jgi:hypothetical protein